MSESASVFCTAILGSGFCYASQIEAVSLPIAASGAAFVMIIYLLCQVSSYRHEVGYLINLLGYQKSI
jgi:hypothetical protein